MIFQHWKSDSIRTWFVEGWSAVIVGVGNLGSALAHYGGFQERGFGVVDYLMTIQKKSINK